MQGGMSTRDIHDQMKDIYGIELSAEMVSKITDSIIPQIREWKNRLLEKNILLFSWMQFTTRLEIMDRFYSRII